MDPRWIPDRSQIEPTQTCGRSQTNPGQIPGRPQTDPGWIPDRSQANPQKGLRTDPGQILGWIPKGSQTDAELARGFRVLRLFPAFPQLFLDDTKVKNFITCFKGTGTPPSPPNPPQTPSPDQHGSPPLILNWDPILNWDLLLNRSLILHQDPILNWHCILKGGGAEPSAAGSGRGSPPTLALLWVAK